MNRVTSVTGNVIENVCIAQT
ncbi:MAG TPA: hypothetical protein ENO00_07305 [Deltaproteobacteria bacterium]|nr:hypothetical protein [Deltaproteobacteria bacterium]